MVKAFFGSATGIVTPVFAMVAASAIAVVLAAGPAQARGPGVKAETAELLPVDAIVPCVESFEDTCNANANVQRTVYQLFGADPTTQFAAIADNLLPYTVYALYNVSDGTPIDHQLDDYDCTGSGGDGWIGTFHTDMYGKLTPAETIGWVQGVFESDEVYLCRQTDGPVLILSGKFARGAKGGGKNKNK